MNTTRSVVALALLLAVVSGCSRTSECQKLVATVNAGVDNIRATRDAGLDEPAATYHGLSRRYRALAKLVRGLELTHPRLKKIAEEYADLYDRAAQATERTAEAIEASEKYRKARLTAQRRELARIVGEEKQLVRRTDLTCKP